ncbi:STM4015 family protein [Actinocorallia populi]|uniref:STM4015 family protein n=1 Tax=Actinocorallia populi TaxID=2079200 RepID=UPI000D091B19|nr:STM4015 family protein [Actinocorallia populi]
MTKTSHYEYVESFAGLPVFDFTPETGPEGLPGSAQVAWRVRLDDFIEDFAPFQELFSRFLESVDTASVTALIIGNWGATHEVSADRPLRLLTDEAERFPALKALFFGEWLQQETEISWIEQGDVTPLFTAFPGLETVVIRGGSGMALSPLTSSVLSELRLETGGLPGSVVRALGASGLPALRSLELWLGVDEYGGDTALADLGPLLSGERFPGLRHLGLQDAEIQDEIAAAVAGAPVVAQLESLSLSMGMLTDEGAEALLSGQPLSHLKHLDLHHHYLSDEMIERVRAALPGVDVDLGDKQRDEWRYVAVAE